jgi:hypothetical protein
MRPAWQPPKDLSSLAFLLSYDKHLKNTFAEALADTVPLCLLNVTHDIGCREILPRRCSFGTVVRYRNGNGFETVVKAYADAFDGSDGTTLVVGFVANPHDCNFVRGAQQSVERLIAPYSAAVRRTVYTVVDHLDDPRYAAFLGALDVVIIGAGSDALHTLAWHRIAMKRTLVMLDCGREEPWIASSCLLPVASRLEPCCTPDGRQYDDYVCSIREMSGVLRSARSAVVHSGQQQRGGVNETMNKPVACSAASASLGLCQKVVEVARRKGLTSIADGVAAAIAKKNL